MSDPKYNLDAIDDCRSTVGTAAKTVPAAGDGLPQNVAAATFGEVANAARLATALNTFVTGIGTEYDAGGEKLAGVERALDSIGQTVHANEEAAKKTMTPTS